MGSNPQDETLHFVLFPLMAQGHMNPMMDIAKILAQQKNVIITVITTPQNASRFTSILSRFNQSGFHINLLTLQFPCKELGLPQGCDNLDLLPSLGSASSFFNASKFLNQQVEKLFEQEFAPTSLLPPPSCIISDMCLPYTIHIARKLNIPRISFGGVSCFYLLCMHNVFLHNLLESNKNESEYFVVPGIPDDNIEITIAQTGLGLKGEDWEQFNEDLAEAEKDSYGVIINSFEELELEYAREYKKVKNDKVWCIGPVSLSNKDQLDKIQRGNITNSNSNKRDSIVNEWKHIKWLDSQKQGSVIYACLGSLSNVTSLQLMELGLALEASKRAFIWVIREGSHLEGLENLIKENGFEERVNGRGLVIRGWAPQLMILSHPAIGGFITHCGWNSTLEAICAGVPMVTWPLFADQFLNQSLVVEVLKVGVKVGVKSPMKWGEEEEMGVLVKKEDVERAIEKLMDETSSESEERRKKIRELAKMAKKAVEKGGSSYSNVTLFIQDIMQKKKDVMLSNGNGK